MNLAELYSLSSGQKLDKIYTFEKYYPGLPENYIAIQPWSKASKNYDFWDIVIDLIYPILQKNNIYLVQVGGKDEKPLKYCIQIQGTTNWGQLQYIISRSKLVLTSDSVSSHLAGHYNIPLCVLISNNFKECVAPYFGEKSKQIILEPNRTNKNPSFSMDEGGNKQINEIKPEEIAKCVLKLLSIELDYSFNTLYIGKQFNQKILESGVTDVIDIKQLGAQNIVMRLDINNNLVILQHQLKICPCQILTDQPIPSEILKNYRPSILGVIYKLNEQHDPKFVKELIANKIPYQLISELPTDKLNNIKLEYMDFSIIAHIKSEIPKELIGKDLNNIYMKTSKILMANKKFYNSFHSYINNIECNPNENINRKIVNKNLDILWREINFCYFSELDNSNL